MTRSGLLYELPTWEPPTGDSECSLLRTLLRTPAAAEAEGGLRDRNRAGATMRLSDQIHEAIEDGIITA